MSRPPLSPPPRRPASTCPDVASAPYAPPYGALARRFQVVFRDVDVLALPARRVVTLMREHTTIEADR